jgi:4-hydroxybenzoyl-CoA thioesterase
MPSVFSHPIKIRFSHCDPAGIVYYPTYFDFFNTVLEEWFEALGMNYAARMVGSGIGTPVVHAECDFTVPSRMGEIITMTPLIDAIGRTSLRFQVIGHVGGQERFRAKLVHVFLDLKSGKAIPMPDDVRKLMESYRDASAGWSLTAAA